MATDIATISGELRNLTDTHTYTLIHVGMDRTVAAHVVCNGRVTRTDSIDDVKSSTAQDDVTHQTTDD
jgi:hypothetical protein